MPEETSGSSNPTSTPQLLATGLHPDQGIGSEGTSGAA